MEFELRICDEIISDVINELQRRGKKISELKKSENNKEYIKLRIRSLVTENHFRFVTSTVLKAMLYLGYNINLLNPMADYVKTGNTNNLIDHYIDANESGMDANDNLPLNMYSYLFEWAIDEKKILISTSILAHKKVNGLRLKLAVKAGNDNSIIIPFGKIVAKYGVTPLNGILELYHGNQKVI